MCRNAAVLLVPPVFAKPPCNWEKLPCSGQQSIMASITATLSTFATAAWRRVNQIPGAASEFSLRSLGIHHKCQFWSVSCIISAIWPALKSLFATSKLLRLIILVYATIKRPLRAHREALFSSSLKTRFHQNWWAICVTTLVALQNRLITGRQSSEIKSNNYTPHNKHPHGTKFCVYECASLSLARWRHLSLCSIDSNLNPESSPIY